MKIVFLATTFGSGGAERTITYLSKYMVNHGMDVTVIITSDETFYQIDGKVKLVKLGISSEPTNVANRFRLMVERQVKVCLAVKNEKPDAVVCLLPYAAKYILTQHKIMGYKLITSERANPMFESKKTAEIKSKVYAESDGIIFQTERAKECFPKSVQEKSIVISNAVGNELVYHAPAASIRQKKISAIGRITDQKDYPTMIRAFAEVHEKHPEFVLEIYGSGGLKAELVNLAEQLGVKDSVVFMGACTDAILKAYDSALYVMSSKFEGMPNALMEAMAVGLPCVSTDCPFGPAELINNGVNGLLVPVGDVSALSAAMLRFIDEPEFACKCGNEAKSILKTHSIDSKAGEYLKYILEIINKPHT